MLSLVNNTMMQKKELTVDLLIQAAKDFCKQQSVVYRTELFAVTDGKKVGTIVEHLFQEFLEERYSMTTGSSALGLDLPSVNTDIKELLLYALNPAVLIRIANRRFMALATI